MPRRLFSFFDFAVWYFTSFLFLCLLDCRLFAFKKERWLSLRLACFDFCFSLLLLLFFFSIDAAMRFLLIVRSVCAFFFFFFYSSYLFLLFFFVNSTFFFLVCVCVCVCVDVICRSTPLLTKRRAEVSFSLFLYLFTCFILVQRLKSRLFCGMRSLLQRLEEHDG